MVQNIDLPLHFGKKNLTLGKDDCFWDNWVTTRGLVFIVNPRSSAYWDPWALEMGGSSLSLMLVRSKFSSGSSISWDTGGALTVPVVPSRKWRGGGWQEQAGHSWPSLDSGKDWSQSSVGPPGHTTVGSFVVGGPGWGPLCQVLMLRGGISELWVWIVTDTMFYSGSHHAFCDGYNDECILWCPAAAQGWDLAWSFPGSLPTLCGCGVFKLQQSKSKT